MQACSRSGFSSFVDACVKPIVNEAKSEWQWPRSGSRASVVTRDDIVIWLVAGRLASLACLLLRDLKR